MKEGDVVFARNYRNINKKTWNKRTVDQVLGNQNYIIKTCNEQLRWRRHIIQLLKGGGMEVAERNEREIEEKVEEHRKERVRPETDRLEFEENWILKRYIYHYRQEQMR